MAPHVKRDKCGDVEILDDHFYLYSFVFYLTRMWKCAAHVKRDMFADVERLDSGNICNDCNYVTRNVCNDCNVCNEKEF
ncbi:MAG: hypothetical protein A2W93_06175 [Bacteroidetes bacterium GWF2_43_63]|nr:MAG: hypothetical protein A2W94_06765 [Bacteroidetes bacterium GWE2_42_42]OFY56204.1 MAG: hypothetical protein A2W93_06175 [Bacteroidetes bacterium GWF2_43_63]HBG70568.1 hypothetical protein [Bacteroidales bacterium]HCB61991.1 hypothetical protein [Bacteroidales bacterium]HCY22746.1 hypothetical protein [Bacteroidales bacterium]